jgi:hypothetical protein
MLDPLGVEELTEFVVDKFPSIVGDHQDKFVAGCSFGLGQEGLEDLEGVGFEFHTKNKPVFGVTVNNFEEVMIASPGGRSDRTAQVHVNALQRFGGAREGT